MSEQSINVQLDNNNSNHQPHVHATNDLTTTNNHQSFEKYIDEMKKLYFAILDFLESSDQKYNGILCTKSFQALTKVVHYLQIDNDQEGIQQFLQMINDISDNHCRKYDFNKKVNQLLLHYKNQIKQTLSNYDIYQIFRNNKILLLFLLQNQIITITQPIYDEIITKIESNGNRFCYFFYPELENFIGKDEIKDVKEELLAKNPNIFDDYDSNRQEGENSSYICSLIRQDSIVEFVQYVNRMNYPLSSQIPTSLFETNSFLIENENTTLIEYSAFFGSIQIFQYLVLNKVELKSSLWLYAIHSQNAELIHILESQLISRQNDDDYLKLFIESIKCHNNDFADYFENNFMLLKENDSKQKEKILSCCIKYHNYSHFNFDIVDNDAFFDFCFYNYSKLVNLLLEKEKNEIENKIV